MNVTGNTYHQINEQKQNPAGRKPFFQPKLTINEPNDVYEQEADAMTDKVMRMEQPFIQAKPIPVTPVQRKCAECEKEEKTQRKEMNGEETTASTEFESYIGSLSSGGTLLSNEARNFYEPRFGYDFSNVKVHTDNIAAKSAQSINALAYTSGNNIVFSNGQYAPNTDSGKRLMGHELTHVVQQGGGAFLNNIQRAAFGDVREAEAMDAEEERITKGCPVSDTGTLSKVSWGETNGLYPGKDDKYKPDKWDSAKTCELLRARGAVHAVGQRGEKVHKAMPGSSAIETILKPYHFTNNFLSLDAEIAKAEVRWFYLSPEASLTQHPTMSELTSVKKYGPFYNVGGGDVPKGDTYIHFYKKK